MKSSMIKGAVIFASGTTFGLVVGWVHGGLVGFQISDGKVKSLERQNERLAEMIAEQKAETEQGEPDLGGRPMNPPQPGADEDGFGGDAPEPAESDDAYQETPGPVQVAKPTEPKLSPVARVMSGQPDDSDN